MWKMAGSQPQSSCNYALVHSIRHLVFSLVYIANSNGFLPHLSSTSPWWLILSTQYFLQIPYCGSVLLDNSLSVLWAALSTCLKT